MVKIEEERKRRMEENKRKLEELNLLSLSQSLQNSSLSPQTAPMKKKKAKKPRQINSEMVPTRRSGRLTNMPAPDYREMAVFERVQLPRRVVYPSRNLANRVYASPEARAWAIEEAEKLESTLEGAYPTFVKPMRQSHVTGGFWLGLPRSFSKKYLPKQDCVVNLINEEGSESDVVYLPRKTGLSGGWKAFAVNNALVDGDALVFQLTHPTTLQVYMIRERDFGAMSSVDED